MELPEKYLKLVGTKQKFGGGLFSANKELEFCEYDVLDWRWGSAQIMNMKTMKIEHPTIEYKLKNEKMKRAQWSRGFPVREIIFADDEQ